MSSFVQMRGSIPAHWSQDICRISYVVTFYGWQGDVANEVETEQLVEDIGVSSTENPRMSSFVQMRGSIPAHWSQDISKMVPKPAITFDLSDAYAQTAGKLLKIL